MKLPRLISFLSSLILGAAGTLMWGVAYTTQIDPPIGGIMFCLSILVFIIGASKFASTFSSSNETTHLEGNRMVDIEERKFGLYLTVLRFLTFKITDNLKRIYLDFETYPQKMVLTAFYENTPTELELKLLSKIVSDSTQRISDFSIEGNYKLIHDLVKGEKHDFVVFATYGEA